MSGRRFLATTVCLMMFQALLAPPARGMVIDYVYDDAGRLIKADYNNGRIIRYTYDAAGNLTATQQVVVKNLALIAPRPRAVVDAGSTCTVSWEAPPAFSSFDLLLSLDAGRTWKPLVQRFKGRGYPWTVTPPRGNKPACMLKVVGRNAAGKILDSDATAATFTIRVLDVTAPKGGQMLIGGTTTQVTWSTWGTAATVASTRISYTLDAGLHWLNAAPPLSGNPGSLAWKLPAVASLRTRCRVKVTIKDDTGAVLATDTSTGWFTIHP